MAPAEPPVAPLRPMLRSHHGDAVIDDYAWMADQSDPEFLAYVDAENAYTEAMTSHLGELRAELFAEIKARTLETDLTVPEFVRHSDGSGWWYYSRTGEGLDYETHCRLRAADPNQIPDVTQTPAGEEVLLDENALADGLEFFALGHLDVSPDGTRLAYSVDASGDEHYDFTVIELATRTTLATISDVSAGGCWFSDDAVCYLRLDETWRPHEIWLHQLGGDHRLLLSEPDPRFWLGVDESRDRCWIQLAAESKNSSEVRLLSVGDPTAAPRVVARRREGLEYSVEIGRHGLYIVHNRDAVDFEVSLAPLDASSEAAWQPLLPGEIGTRYLGVSAYDRWLVAATRRDGLPAVDVWPIRPDGTLGDRWPVAVDEPLYSLSVEGAQDPDADRVRLVVSSLVTPAQLIELRLDDHSMRTLKSTPVLDHPTLGPYRAENYVQRRSWATADDGTRIPVSIVHRRDLALNGNAPALLYGYGAYEISTNARFSIARLSLLDRGFVYAIAHVRGGGEFGRSWYDAGRLAEKANTFTDFIACARLLVAEGYTSPGRLLAEGGSAGGLLVGAAINLAPEVFAAVHAAVPFVDALTSMLNPELPLTVVEWEEWGNPLADAAAYATMKAYSPYENLRADARYPALLVTTGMQDTRVEVTEPTKWVAKLRRTVAADPERPILLRVQTAAGHGGPSGRYRAWHDIAFELAWMLDRVGLVRSMHDELAPGQTVV